MTVAYLDVTARNGVPFRVVYIPAGDPNPNNEYRSRYSETKSVVEFFDHRHTGPRFTPDGQFVSNYYVDMLLANGIPNHGLDLDGGIPDWTVDVDTYRKVLAWLDTQEYLCRYPA